MSSAISAFGIHLEMSDVEIAEVKDISGPGLSLNTIDVTAHDGSGWRDFVATLLDAGEVTFEINYVPTGATHDNTAGGLLYAMDQQTLEDFDLIFPDAGTTTWSFDGYVTAFEPGAPVDGALTASVTIRISGDPTLA
jgi:hypothetical protein